MGDTALERAIRAQPDELERLASQRIPHDLTERLLQARRLWLVGTGTSFHAAELGATMLQQAGRGAHALPSMRFVNWAPPVHPQDGVIVISHNAGRETAYAYAAYAMAREAGLRVVAITRREGGLPNSLETVDQERSQTYTVSYTAVLLLLARLAHELGAEDLSPDAVAAVPAAVRDALAAPGTDAIPTPRRLLVLAGEGPAAVTAREGALKLREGARLPAEGYEVEYLLHGSAVPIGPDDHLIVLGSPDTHGLVRAVGAAAAAEGVPVTSLVETASLPPLLAQIPLTVRLQLLALRQAEERGMDPDEVITGAWADEELWRIGTPERG
ncbi:MAG TPA: SIS domain-containing protein [Actinomycetota bacterium]|nr:SIS domain-containing protein [Actinomycetota bacterium]